MDSEGLENLLTLKTYFVWYLQKDINSAVVQVKHVFINHNNDKIVSTESLIHNLLVRMTGIEEKYLEVISYISIPNNTTRKFTRMHDSYGTPIFEGDEIEYYTSVYCEGEKGAPLRGIVKWNDYCCTYEPLVISQDDYDNNCFMYVVSEGLRSWEDNSNIRYMYPKPYTTVIFPGITPN